VVLLVDREYVRGRRRYDFMGSPRALPESHLLLAFRTGAPIFVGTFFFEGQDRFGYEIEGPFRAPAAPDREKSWERLQRLCLDSLERMIRKRPTQWFHFQPLREGNSRNPCEEHCRDRRGGEVPR